MKRIFTISMIFINLSCLSSCGSANSSKKETIWYEKEVVREIKYISENQYLIEIGISAQIFYLDNKIDDFNNTYKTIYDSYQNKVAVKIEIENNTNRILSAERLKT